MPTTRFMRTLFLVTVLFAAAVLGAAPARAQAPSAGTSIGNQATATYQDGSGATRSVTSNVVLTVVQQVASFTLTSNNTLTAAVGNVVYFPHVISNTGNGSDSFKLSVAQTSGFTANSVTIYYDANGNGIVDPGDTVIANNGSTPTIPAGGAAAIIVQATVPSSATGSSVLTLTGSSNFNVGLASQNNTDTVNVTANAVIPVTKAVSSPTAVANATTQYTYTLAYTNTGNSTATSLKLTDTLPAGVTYVTGSGVWSGSGTALTDALAGDPAGIAYDFGLTTANTVTATISSVAAGQSGFVTFKFTVNANTAAGVVYNQAGTSYNDGSGTTITGTTNKCPLTVLPNASVGLTGETIASANQGAEVLFHNVVTNNGNKTDTFNITVNAAVTNPFPTGTTFVLYQSDGVTPLLDTNQDGIPDTGALDPTKTYTVVLKAILPASASAGGPYSVQKTATSSVDPTQKTNVTDTLTTINASTVDLTNTSAYNAGTPAPGQGAGPEASPVTTLSVNPGSPATFTLFVNNLSNVSDSYVLQASTDSTFATQVLPSGWTVTFLNGTTAVTNTGLIAKTSNQQLSAVVQTTSNALAGSTEVYFRVLSPTTGAKDVKHDRVTVNTVRSLTINPNGTGQVYPGGSVVYPVSIRNTGNVLEGDGAISTTSLALGDTVTGFTSVVYWDKNNNGVLDPTDPIITSLAALTGGSNGASTVAGLDPGEAATLFVKVYAPSGATVGTVDTATLTATTTGTINSVAAPAAAIATDTTTVISGNLVLTKFQSLTAPDATGAAPWVTTTLTAGATPGATIYYKIVLTNNGTANATSVVVTDPTPAFTLYSKGDNTTTPPGKGVMTTDGTTFTAVTTPTDGTTGTIQANVGTLTPGQSATVYFCVKIRP